LKFNHYPISKQAIDVAYQLLPTVGKASWILQTTLNNSGSISFDPEAVQHYLVLPEQASCWVTARSTVFVFFEAGSAPNPTYTQSKVRAGRQHGG